MPPAELLPAARRGGAARSPSAPRSPTSSSPSPTSIYQRWRFDKQTADGQAGGQGRVQAAGASRPRCVRASSAGARWSVRAARMMDAVPTADVDRHQPDALRGRAALRPGEPSPRSWSPRAGPPRAAGSASWPRERGVPSSPTRRWRARCTRRVEVGQMIPEELYEAVAQLLAYVYRVAGAREAAGMERVPQAGIGQVLRPARGRRRRARRGDDDHPAAAVPARPVHHAEHLGRRW